jgi:hypothetical protein
VDHSSALDGRWRHRRRQFVDPVLDAVLAEVGVVGAERVRLDAVDADLEVRVVHARHEFGAGDVEDLVAALVALEVVQGRVGRLQHRAHRPVCHHHPFRECLAEGASAMGGVRRDGAVHDGRKTTD